MSTCTIVGVRWEADGPLARVFADEAQRSVLEPLVGLRLGYRCSGGAPRRCVGRARISAEGSAHVDCADPAEPGQRTCRRCAIAEATFAANLHHAHTRERGDIAPEFQAHLRKPNVLYLAAFRDGSVKIGTSTAERSALRLAEQGAWHARVIAEASDGYAVRDVEDKVTADLGVTQSIPVRRKLDGMVTPLRDDHLDVALDELVPQVHQVIEAMADARLVPTTMAWTHPQVERDVWGHVHRYPPDLATGRHDLEVVGACGRLVAVHRPGGDDVFVADLGRLFGVVLELGDFGSEELAVQESLF